jgi:hypothetical protein
VNLRTDRIGQHAREAAAAHRVPCTAHAKPLGTANDPTCSLIWCGRDLNRDDIVQGLPLGGLAAAETTPARAATEAAALYLLASHNVAMDAEQAAGVSSGNARSSQKRSRVESPATELDDTLSLSPLSLKLHGLGEAGEAPPPPLLIVFFLFVLWERSGLLVPRRGWSRLLC